MDEQPEDDLTRKQALQERIRIVQGRFNKKEIVQMCREEIAKNGFVVLNDKFPKANSRTLEMAIPQILDGGKNKLDLTPFNKEWFIYPNPDYKSKYKDFKLALVTGAITLAAGIILWLIDNQSKHLELQDIKSRLERIEKSK